MTKNVMGLGASAFWLRPQMLQMPCSVQRRHATRKRSLCHSITL